MLDPAKLAQGLADLSKDITDEIPTPDKTRYYFTNTTT